jgi:hypothetical protein
MAPDVTTGAQRRTRHHGIALHEDVRTEAARRPNATVIG